MQKAEVFLWNKASPGFSGNSGQTRGQLFENLSEDSLQYLLQNSIIQEFPAERELIQQGDKPTHLYYIIDGIVKTLRYSPEGHEATIRLLQPGDTFMEAVLFMGGPSPISVVVMEDARLLMVPEHVVKTHSMKDSQFANNLLRIVTRHYKTAMQQIDSVITRSPIQRVGYYFLKLHMEQGSESMEIDLPFKKATIANHLGMTPETFSRALNQIRKFGIDIDQEHITLKDSYALCQFCDQDTAHSCTQKTCPECPMHEQEF